MCSDLCQICDSVIVNSMKCAGHTSENFSAEVLYSMLLLTPNHYFRTLGSPEASIAKKCGAMLS